MVTRCDIHLAADHRPNPGFDRRTVKLKSPEEIAVVSHCDSRHLHCRNLPSQIWNSNRRIEQ
jgi:hypothetical protein